jgi:alkanesulfonate monooxygenase SsuD/methylene tetrahydromethanopterin reductase-like flavin-dependent oxidoreductase (luciferase family)
VPGPISLLFPETRSVTAVRELAVRTEAQGFRGMELGAAFGFDPIMALAAAGPATTELLLGVAVVPTWPRHPVVMAQQAATASALTGGRFRLGVGPSHEPVMGMYGIDASRPLGHLEDYLTIVQGLLHQGNVRHKGERYRVTAFLDVADAPPPPVRLAVLRPRMCRLAGRLADGALPWLTPAASCPRWPPAPPRRGGRRRPSWRSCRAHSPPAATRSAPWPPPISPSTR